MFDLLLLAFVMVTVNMKTTELVYSSLWCSVTVLIQGNVTTGRGKGWGNGGGAWQGVGGQRNGSGDRVEYWDGVLGLGLGGTRRWTGCRGGTGVPHPRPHLMLTDTPVKTFAFSIARNVVGNINFVLL